MNIHPQHHPSYFKAKSYLRSSRDKEVATNRLIADDKLPVKDGYELIEWTYANNIAAGKRNGFYYMLGSGIVVAIFLAILMFTGRFYYIILPFALFSFFKGLHEFLTTNGFDG
jgi:hypothetical protein